MGGGGAQKFSTGLQLSEYVQIACRNTNGTCLKSVSKTHTLRFFRFFRLQRLCFEQKLEILIRGSGKNAKNLSFFVILGQKGQNGENYQKKTLGTFFSLLQAPTNFKVSEKSNEQFPRKSVAFVRMDGRTNGQTRLLRSQRPVGRETKKNGQFEYGKNRTISTSTIY